MFLQTHKIQSTASHQRLTEDEMFKKPCSKSWIPTKNHHTVKTFVEATNNDIDPEIKNQSIRTFLKGNKKHQKN